MSRPTAPELLGRSLTTGSPVAVIDLDADALAHYREGRVVAIDATRFVLAFQDPAGLARQASFDLTNPNDVLSVEPVR
jgi:hypothetical protein